MKTFDPAFFKNDNFVLLKKEYGAFAERINKETIHICYNVNNAFIPVMGGVL